MNARALNSKLNHEEFAKRGVQLQSLPRMVFLELTRSCNLACPMCRPSILAGKHLTMTDAVLRRFEEDLFPYIEVLDLRGWGESTLDRRLFGLVDSANAAGIKTKLFTNLTTHGEKFWQQMGARPITIAVSLEAATPGVYEQFRKGGRFERLCKNLAAVRAEQLKRGGTSDLYLSAVISDDNIDQITQLVRLAAEHTIPVVRLNPISSYDGVSNYPITGVSQASLGPLREALHTARSLAHSLGVSLQLAANLCDSTSDYGGYDLCLHPWSYVYVRYDGGIGFCDHLVTHPDSIFGNLLEHSFMEIWNNEAYQVLRKEHLEKRFERLHNQGIECDWCYRQRYADCEDFIEPSFRPLNLTQTINIDLLLQA